MMGRLVTGPDDSVKGIKTFESQLPAENEVWSGSERVRVWVLSHLKKRFGSSLTKEDREDAFQNAWIGFSKVRSKPDVIRNPLGLLIIIAERRCMDLLRQTGHVPLKGLPKDVPGSNSETYPGEVLDLLLLLPDLQREIVTLRFVESLTLREISERLEMSISTVFNQCREGVAVLRDHLGLPLE